MINGKVIMRKCPICKENAFYNGNVDGINLYCDKCGHRETMENPRAFMLWHYFTCLKPNEKKKVLDLLKIEDTENYL